MYADLDFEALQSLDNMIVAVPGTGAPGAYPTNIRVFATEKGFFVSAVMQQPVASLVQRLTPRDQFIDRDTFGFTLDTTGAGLYAYWFIVADFLILGWIGQKPVETPYIEVGQVATVFYFLFFLVLIPVIGLVEKALIRAKV